MPTDTERVLEILIKKNKNTIPEQGKNWTKPITAGRAVSPQPRSAAPTSKGVNAPKENAFARKDITSEPAPPDESSPADIVQPAETPLVLPVPVTKNAQAIQKRGVAPPASMHKKEPVRSIPGAETGGTHAEKSPAKTGPGFTFFSKKHRDAQAAEQTANTTHKKKPEELMTTVRHPEKELVTDTALPALHQPHDPPKIDRARALPAPVPQSAVSAAPERPSTFSLTDQQDGEIRTKIDELYEMVLNENVVRIQHAAKALGVVESDIEAWAKILKENKMIEIFYPAFGKIKLLAPSHKVKKWEKQSRHTK